jgi:2-aminoadipate transaminase
MAAHWHHRAAGRFIIAMSLTDTQPDPSPSAALTNRRVDRAMPDAPDVSGDDADAARSVQSLLADRVNDVPSSIIRDLLALVSRNDVLSLAGGLPCPEGFDVQRIAEASNRALHLPGRYGAAALQYGETIGTTELRTLIARQHNVDIDQVVITSGSQQALDLLGRALLNPDDVAVVETPSYLGARQALGAWTRGLHGVPADVDGLDTSALASQIAAGLRPKLVYVVTDFQNPTGSTLSAERRSDLVAMSERYGFAVIADDPYGELRFSGTRPPALRGSRVIQLGTTSKTLAPGLRVGWMIAPVDVARAVVRLKQATDLHTSTFAQLVAADLLGDVTWFETHLARLRQMYRDRAATLFEALPDGVDAQPPTGGMFVWATVAGGSTVLDVAALLAAAVETGVAFVPGSAFGGPANSMRLSYSSLSPAELVVAAERLGSVLDVARGRGRPGRMPG